MKSNVKTASPLFTGAMNVSPPTPIVTYPVALESTFTVIIVGLPSETAGIMVVLIFKILNDLVSLEEFVVSDSSL